MSALHNDRLRRILLLFAATCLSGVVLLQVLEPTALWLLTWARNHIWDPETRATAAGTVLLSMLAQSVVVVAYFAGSFVVPALAFKALLLPRSVEAASTSSTGVDRDR